jgi:GDP-L-fucose synthase
MIVVTGAGGVLGQAVTAELQRQGREYSVVGSRDLDLRDPNATLSYFERVRPAQVLHLAGRVHGLQGNREFPAEMFIDNIRINANVIDAARRVGATKVVGASTVATYPPDVPMPTSEASIWDGPPHGSESSYGHAKRAMLAHLEACKLQYGLDYAYPILTNIYGPYDRFDARHGHVIPSLISKFYDASLTGGAVPLWGTGKAERDFIYSGDAARALILILDKASGPINVASGVVVPIRSAVELLQSISNVQDAEWDPAKPDGQLLRRYDITKLAALGFHPETSLEEGLRKTYEWYATNYPNVRVS